MGKSKIELIIDDMAILENYTSTRGNFQGKSLNKYNPRLQCWEQFWVDNSGLTLHLKGNPDNGNMVLSNAVETEKGVMENKISWFGQEDGTVRQVWERKSGEEWSTVFDGTYRPREKRE